MHIKNTFKICLYKCVCLVAQSCPTLHNPLDCSPPSSSIHGDSPGKNTGVGCYILLQGTFPTQGSNLGLPHCRQTLYHLSHQGSPYKCVDGKIKIMIAKSLQQRSLTFEVHPQFILGRNCLRNLVVSASVLHVSWVKAGYLQGY